jgi:hypothetical protein
LRCVASVTKRTANRSSASRVSVFLVATADAEGTFRIDQLKVAQGNRQLAEEVRAALMSEFIQRRPVVLHNFDDELRLARFCETIWLCDKTRRIRAALEQERQG